jgi:hypothetical protein
MQSCSPDQEIDYTSTAELTVTTSQDYFGGSKRNFATIISEHSDAYSNGNEMVHTLLETEVLLIN